MFSAMLRLAGNTYALNKSKAGRESAELTAWDWNGARHLRFFGEQRHSQAGIDQVGQTDLAVAIYRLITTTESPRADLGQPARFCSVKKRPAPVAASRTNTSSMVLPCFQRPCVCMLSRGLRDVLDARHACPAGWPRTPAAGAFFQRCRPLLPPGSPSRSLHSAQQGASVERGRRLRLELPSRRTQLQRRVLGGAWVQGGYS
eukprot:364901-Chlamydomonas_euryale.AAC.2